MQKLLLIYIAFFVSLTLFAQSHKEAKLLLPDVKEDNNWRIKDSVEVYSGDDLFMYINGGADIYLEYGFEEVATCKFLNNAAKYIHIDIYRMKDDPAAYGIFTLNSTSKGKPLEIGAGSFLYDYYLDFWKGPYFVRCTSSKKEVGLMDTLQMFARSIEDKIDPIGKVPKLTQAFQLSNYEINKLKYIKGSIGLNNIFNFGHGSISGFNEGLIGKWEDKQLFVFAYDYDRKRREWFASAKGKMQMNKKFSDYIVVEDGFTVKDKAGNFVCFKPYKKFIIVVKGTGWNEATPLFNEIQTKLDGI